MAFFVAIKPVPILNQASFADVFSLDLPFDDYNLVRALEMIAYPGSVFKVIRKCSEYILEVQTAEYPTLHPLFIDKRFGIMQKTRPLERKSKMPPVHKILKHIKSRIGMPYIWGGNIGTGIPDLLKYYPPQKKLMPFELDTWVFRGLDCSGLLYEALHGSIPRNTQDLLFIGKSVSIKNLSWKEIAQVLRRLDLIIWKGHILIVVDDKKIIESKHGWGGVCLTNVSERLKYLKEVDRKIPADDPAYVLANPNMFLIRRFIS